MAYSFQTTSQQRIHEKVGCYLAEIGVPFESFAGEVPGYVVQSGSASASVLVLPAGESECIVGVVCTVVRGANVGDPALLEFLLRQNDSLLIAELGIDASGDIMIHHTLVGSGCTRSSLHGSLVNVLSAADNLDDQIVERWGGKRALEPPPPKPSKKDAPKEEAPEPRVILSPTSKGIGDGKVVFILFGLKTDYPLDQRMLAGELAHLEDDIAVLRGAGYRVVIDRQATQQTLVEALSGKSPGLKKRTTAAVYWSGHGSEDGSLEACDGSRIPIGALDGVKVSPDLRMVVFSSCYVGQRARAWRKALGGHPLVVGWGRPVTVERALEFLDPNEATDTGLDDLIRRYLLADTPIPPEPEIEGFTPADSVLSAGTRGDLPKTMADVVAMLGAKMLVRDNHLALTVPLESGRSQRAEVCLLESSEPFIEGEQLVAVQSDVGEVLSVVDPAVVLSAVGKPGFARVVAVRGAGDVPRVVLQGFLPRTRARTQDLAAMIYEVCRIADALELRVFGTNRA